MTIDQTLNKITGNDGEILEELKKIRSLLEPKPAPPAPPAPKGIIKEFKAFLEQYKVMGMAVAFILGIYLGQLVAGLVTDLVMPVIDLAMPGVNWATIHVGPFLIGEFIGTLITFLIVAFVIFLMVKVSAKAGIK
jgi:large conductance mechanosensitive channel